MTEKRFTLNSVLNFDYGICDYGEPIGSLRNICELLNELHEENKTFREALQELKEIGDYQAMTINELHEENQSLKFQLDECQNHKLFSRRELEKENEQLKKENMEYYHLINCGNCKYHNYDWFDDGDEFEVCDKGHTERLMYNKFCKEWKEL